MGVVALHEETSVARIGVQSALGTAASNMRRITLWGSDDPIADAARKTFPNLSQTHRRRENLPPIYGPRVGAGVKLMVPVRALPSVLNAAATPVAYSNASALGHQLLLRAGLGAELTPTAGSVVVSSSGTPVDSITVTTGHGVRFVVGQILILVESAAVYVRRVTAVATDAVSISPPLPTGVTPTVGAVVRSTYCYYPAERDSTVFTVEHSFIESGTPTSQRRALGVYGGLELTTTTNEPAALTFTGTSVDHTDPGDLSISLDPVAEDMGAPLVWTPSTYWATSLATAPAVAEIASIKISIPRAWQTVPGAAVNGVGSVYEVAGRNEPIAVEIEGIFDSAWWTTFENASNLSFLTHTSYGSGTSARVAGVWMGKTHVYATPVRTKIGKLIAVKAVLHAETDTTITGAAPSLSTAEIRTAPAIVYYG